MVVSSVTHGKPNRPQTVDTELQTVFEGPVILAPYTYFYSLYA